jgi:hypothetical protein
MESSIMSQTSLTKEQESKLGEYIRKCEIDKSMNQYLNRELTKCEFGPHYISKKEVFIGSVLLLLVGGYIGHEMK